MCFLFFMKCDCARRLVVACSCCRCRHQCILRSIVAIVLAPVGDNTKGPKPTAARPAAKVWFAVDMEAHAEPSAEPTKQDKSEPIKRVSGRAWSPGIYQALRLLGKSLDVAWERAFIHPLTLN